MALISKHKDGYAKIHALAKEDSDLPLRPVDLSIFAPKGLLQRLQAWGIGVGVPAIMPILRWFPTFKLFDLHWVTRDAEVRAVLSDNKAFEVPFGLEMTHLTKGATFCLGDDGELHRRQRVALEEAWKGMDDEKDVREPARRFAQALLADSGGEVDVVGDLIRQVVARVSERLLGCQIDDFAGHSNAVIAVASFLFGDPYGVAQRRKEGLLAARNLKPTIDAMVEASIDNQNADQVGFIGIIPGMARALHRHLEDGADKDYDLAALRGDLEATGYGMTTAFAVTHGFVGGILQTLGNRPAQMKKAILLAQQIKSARSEGDSEEAQKAVAQFDRLMMEASRFNPAIYPGSFRVRTKRRMQHAQSHPALDRIPEGQAVMVCTASAVRDRRCKRNECRDPSRFDPERFESDSLQTALGFGHGIHACVGARQAISIASETLIALLTQDNIRFESRRPKVKMHGPVHVSLKMKFDPEFGALKQSQILIPIPLRSEITRDEANARLRSLENEGNIAAVYDATNIVHFSSLHIIALGKKGKEKDHLLVELNVDGTQENALRRIQQFAEKTTSATDGFRRLAELVLDPQSLHEQACAPLFSKLRQNAVTLTQAPFGHTGGNFVGTGEFSVAQIAAEAELTDLVDDYLVDQAQIDAHEKRPDSTAEWSSTLFSLACEKVKASHMESLLIRLQNRGPQFARMPEIGFKKYLVRYATQPIYKWLFITYGVVSFLSVFAGLFWGWSIFIVVVMTPLLLLAGLLISLFLWLRRREKKEIPDDSRVAQDRLRAIRAAEERSGIAQTHITSVSTFKTGIFRRLTFSLAMHVITSFVKLWFRPGFLTDFATIHYARWVRFKGTDQMVFQSNYDGSWESYLEDFITKVHQGQTLAWNNAKGFPKTKFLWFDGARDGDRFKRWVRNQQVETCFWYTRFPNLTIPQIHRNSLVRDGLARARDVSDHRDWLKLFGSVPHKGTELETDQIQSIVFNGHGNHQAAACLPIKFGSPDLACRWLRSLVAKSQNTKSAGDVAKGGKKGGGLINRPGLKVPALSFGDGEPVSSALFIGFSANGLAKLGLPDENQCGLTSFPSPFLDGMRARGAALDDPSSVQWSDAGWLPATVKGHDANNATHTSKFEADAVLFVYLKPTPESVSEQAEGDVIFVDRFNRAVNDLKIVLDSLESELEDSKIETIGASIDLSRKPGVSASLGGFGFHEGASQPVIRGSRQASRKHVLEQDIMEPGEFVLGYEDSRGFVPPAITLRADTAAKATLPFAATPRPEPYPHFGNPETGHTFDLGRNGSFLAIRQLEHTRDAAGVEQFDNFVDSSANKMLKQIENGIPKGSGDVVAKPFASEDPSSTPGRPTATTLNEVYSFSAELEFLKDLTRAKLIGRWRDGSSLVRHPLLSATALVRQRTYRELMESPASGLARSANQAAIRDILPPKPGDEIEPGSYDRLLWDDKVWDLFVANLRRAIAAIEDEDMQPAIAQAILQNKWLKPALEWPRMVDNEFQFGRDDPQGLSCPIGSHIRRSNPRDTPNPNNDDQVAINNRHRLLRRGRPYRETSSGSTRGTFFMCLNADIERQFEFVQRTWLNATNFQGLVNQPDPIAAPHKPGDRFIIPHTSNFTDLRYQTASTESTSSDAKCALDFTRLVGGGYFFLPSKAALRYLTQSK